VVFNEKDTYLANETVVIPGDVLAEGERDKLLQPSPNNSKQNDKSANSNESSENEVTTNEAPNSIPFPLATSVESAHELPDYNDNPNIVQGKHARPNPGTYAQWNKEGLHTNTLQMEEGVQEVVDDNDSLSNWTALATAFGDEPRSLKEALETPEASQWQAAHDYEIAQLENMKVWEIVKPLDGALIIPCSEVFHVKRGTDGEMESF